jgi:hypothetical protein
MVLVNPDFFVTLVFFVVQVAVVFASRLVIPGGVSRGVSLLGITFAPICARTGNLAEKPGENRQSRGEKWRQLALFRGS